MDKKSNMKQAMYEMFGVGSMPAAEPVAAEKEEQPIQAEPAVKHREEAKLVSPQKAENEKKKEEVASVAAKPKAAASYLAPGTVMEGTLHAVGDVEIAGEFKGDITTEGTVILHANIQGNLSVSRLDLSGCKLIGDVVAGDVVTVSEDSEICGNVTAKELRCAGRITGDLNIAGTMVLEKTSRIQGDIISGTLSVEKGAVIKGGIEIRAAD